MHNPMTRRRRAPMTPTDPTPDRLFEVGRAQRELRADLEQLRRELAGELRTRRLVVDGPNGVTTVEGGSVTVENGTAGSHVDLQAGVDGAEVRVYSGPAEGTAGFHPESSRVVIYAGSVAASEDAEVGVMLYTGDDNGRWLVDDCIAGRLEAQVERHATVIHGAGAVLGSLLDLPAEGSCCPNPASHNEVDRLRGELANAVTVVRMLAAASRTAVEALSGTETGS